eukprot:2329894-Amphidinium_carterae.1
MILPQNIRCDKTGLFQQRTLKWKEKLTDFTIQWAAKHMQQLIEMVNLGKAKVVGRPGSKTTGNQKSQQQSLHAEGKAFTHSAAGLLQYVGLDIKDILYALKAVSSEVSSPAEATRMKAKRLIMMSYLISHDALEW